MAAFLSYMALSGFFGKRNVEALEVEIELPPELYAGVVVPVTVRIRNRKRFFPGFLLKVLVNGREVIFPYLDARTDTLRTVEMVFPRRGKTVIEAVHVCSVFPFNFFVRCKRVGGPFECVVFPAPVPCDLVGFGADSQRLPGELISDASGYDSEITSIREYVEGDPLKYIHWKATARTGSLKTKELASAARRPVVLDLTRMPGNGLEERLGRAVFAVQTLIRRRQPVGLRLGAAVVAPGLSLTHKQLLLRELALYGLED